MPNATYTQIKKEIAKAYIGDNKTISALVTALFAGGHVLLEGVPGLAKTTLAKALASTIDASFRRVQFTMDLMPLDITGSNIYKMNDGEFRFIPGPIFTNILLADEINRASARTQSALLEAMQENQVTVDGQTYALEQPFFVIATQNSTEERGTWPLPESELDRFMFRIRLGYPSAPDEQRIVMLSSLPDPTISPVIKLSDFKQLHKDILNVRTSENIAKYIADIIRQTRRDPDIARGASPRAGATMLKAARSCAFLNDREFITPDDVREVAPFVLNHRLILKPDAPPVDEVIRRTLTKVAFS